MEPECSPKCRSLQHGNSITSALSKGNETDALTYIRHVCCNVTRVLDGLGRNALHVASACGKSKIVEWLLRCEADVNVKDGESGWTALHRSLFYGQLVAAKLLILHGASLQSVDHEGHTPLDLVMKDRLPYIDYSLHNPCDAYVWGTNTNFNLGLESQQSKTTPELIDNFKRENVGIQQIVMCKFHTLFLSSDGKIYACGHGHGGRLGHGNEQTSLVPKQVKALAGEECVQVAAGVDHTVILTSKGAVWTCGLNNCHQLGHNPPPERQLSPKPIKFFHQNRISITGICAARYHTIAYTKDGVYSFGLNAGHLGHLKGDKTEINPRLVSALNLHDTEIVGVVASDGATICWTNKGDVYVLHEYQCRKIASKQMNIQNIVAIGGHLDFKCDPILLKERGGIEFKILLLTKYGKIFLWTESNPHLTRCLFSLPRQLYISSLVLNNASVGIISDKGEGFVGYFSTKHVPNVKTKSGDGALQKERNRKESHSLDSLSKDSVFSRKNSTCGFVDFLNKDECYLIRVERMQAIHRGVFVTSDPKGRNFAVLQSYPTFGMIETLEVAKSEFVDHFELFLEDSSVYDMVYDCTFRVGNLIFPAHKYILASNSEYCRKLLKEVEDIAKPEIKLDNVHQDIFRHVLQFIYTQKCDFFKIGYRFNHLVKSVDKDDSENLNCASHKKDNKKTEKESKNNQQPHPVKLMHEVAKKFGLKLLIKRLETLKHSNNKVTSVAGNDGVLKYSRKRFPEFYDVIIETEDGHKLQCHKCILVARSEYFHSMFASNWIESVGSGFLHLPVTSDVLEVVLDYLYMDEVANVDKLVDVDFTGRILIVADQLLLKRLKTICENILASMITLKNAAELMQFSFTYQAEQLQNVCMEFICINLAAILETKNLAIISDDAMLALTKRYKEMIIEMQYRHLTPYADGPTVEEIQSIALLYPNTIEDDTAISSSPKSEALTNVKKHKSKRKSRVRRDTETEVANVTKHASIESTECQSDLDDILTSPSPEPSSDSSMTEIKIKSMPIAIPTPRMKDKSIKLDFTPLSQLKMDNLAWSACSKEKKSLDLKEIMCQQETESKQLLKMAAKSPNNHKKTQKLSQKKRKQLTSISSLTDLEPSSPQMSPDSGISRSPKFNVWGSMEKSAHSLKDIMKDERCKTTPDSKTRMSPKPPIDVILTPELLNPWHHRKSEDSTVPKFVDILLDEQNQKPAAQPKTKPLHLIQIEQQAIEELEQFYNAHAHPDERVTVMRILPATMPPPLWKGRQKDKTYP